MAPDRKGEVKASHIAQYTLAVLGVLVTAAGDKTSTSPTILPFK